MPGCIHREHEACPFCRHALSAAVLLGLVGCAGGDGGEDSAVVALYGVEIVDEDNDGYDAEVDCDDSDPSIHPDAEDTEGDGIDQNCDDVDGVAGS